jgi:hypothetical protein
MLTVSVRVVIPGNVQVITQAAIVHGRIINVRIVVQDVNGIQTTNVVKFNTIHTKFLFYIE